MTSPLTADVKTRIETVAATISGVATVVTTRAPMLTVNTLPALEVRPMTTTWTKPDADHAQCVTVCELWLFAAECKDSSDAAQALAALEAAYPFMTSIPFCFLITAPRLEVDGVAYGGLDKLEVGQVACGLSPYYDNQTYGVVRVPLSVTTTHQQ